MSHRTVPLKLAPAGLVVDRHEIGTAGIIVHVHGASPTSTCPACGLASSSVHSRYGRTLGDLPAHGRRLRIRLAARRFRCRNAACERRVFAERFAPDPLAIKALNSPVVGRVFANRNGKGLHTKSARLPRGCAPPGGTGPITRIP